MWLCKNTQLIQQQEYLYLTQRILTNEYELQSLFIYTTVTTSKPSSDNFISHNVRATNKYIDTCNLVYLINRNYNPVIKRWLISKGIDVNQDIYALAEMIQWVFRSSVRKKEGIRLYVPSKRMRELFQNWINGVVPKQILANCLAFFEKNFNIHNGLRRRFL